MLSLLIFESCMVSFFLQGNGRKPDVEHVLRTMAGHPQRFLSLRFCFFSHKSTLFVPSCLFVCLVQATYLFLVAGTFSIFWYACAVRSALLLDQRPKIFTSRTQPPTSQKQGPSVIMNIYLAKCYVVSNVLPTCTWKICSVSSTWIVRVSSTWMSHLNLIRST